MGLMGTVARGLALSAGLPQALTPPAGAGTSPQPQLEASIADGPGGLQLASPWAPATPQLQSILWQDVVGVLKGENTPLTRESAMGVPALARARHLVCGFGAKCQLQVFTGEQP